MQEVKVLYCSQCDDGERFELKVDRSAMQFQLLLVCDECGNKTVWTLAGCPSAISNRLAEADRLDQMRVGV